jgi:hypothetical protein
MGDVIHINQFSRRSRPAPVTRMGRLEAMSDDALKATFRCFERDPNPYDTTIRLMSEARSELARRGITPDPD